MSKDIFEGLDNDLSAEGAGNADNHGHDNRGQLTSAANAIRYIEAGKATITLVSLKTETRFTYKITANEDRTCFFVGVLTGADNESNYQYIGRIARGIFWQGRKVPKPGDISKDAPSSKAFDWAWRKLAKGELPETVEIWHESNCGRCGRKLTVPSSVSQGFGPECVTKIGL